MKKLILALLTAAAVTAPAWAIPARRALYQMTGPDGRTITVEKTGDEFGHHYVDASGRILISEGNRLVYASEAKIADLMQHRTELSTARNAGILARAKARAEANTLTSQRKVPGQIGTFPGTSFPPLGKQKGIVILVEFKDRSFKIGSDEKAAQFFTDMLNKEGFSEQGATGSARDYFLDSSNGRFDCDFDVFGPVKLKNTMRYYGGNDSYGNDLRPEEMVIEACDALDTQVDFSQYDRDNDGVIDNVYLIYAGFGEASYDDEDTVWPHSWSVVEAGYSKIYDGVKLDTYGCSNEWEEYVNNWTGGPNGIGTFVHEFSHILGLPDLYHTSNSNATYTPGAWSVLDYGPYNNDGNTPPAYSSFERNALGWIDLTELTAESGNATLQDINTSNAAYCITNPDNESEFFLLESRIRKGWDAYLPADGMLVWHVDYDYNDWFNNAVNNTQSHQGVDLVEADGQASKYERNGGDCFPGTAKTTSWTPKWWSKKTPGFMLENIAAATSGEVTFTVSQSSNGGNTGEDPEPGEYLTVSDVLRSDVSIAKSGTVRGYIVGYVSAGGRYDASHVNFMTEGSLNSNLVLGDSKEADNHSQCIPVRLSKGTLRDELNLADNPANLGRYVEISGTIGKYFSVPGISAVSGYRFLTDPDDFDAISEVETTTTPAQNAIFDLSGRRVTNPLRGIYIVNGRKVFIN